MKKVLIIGGGAMGAAFSVPLIDNNQKVTLTEPYNTKLLNQLLHKKKISSQLKNCFTKKIIYQKIFSSYSLTKMGFNCHCCKFYWNRIDKKTS